MQNPFKRPDAGGVSFLPEDYVARKAEARTNIIILSLFGVVMFCVVSAFFVTNRQWLTVRAQQHTINIEYTEQAKKIDELKTLEEQKAQMMDKAEITTALLERVPRSVLAAELVTRMPEDVSLLSMKLESKRLNPEDASGEPGKRKAAPVKTLSKSRKSKDKEPAKGKGSATDKPAPEKVTPPKFETTMTLTGVASATDNNASIADYITALKECPLIGSVELSYIKEIKLQDTQFRQFEVQARVRSDADARSIVPIEDLQAAREAIQEEMKARKMTEASDADKEGR